MHFLVLASAIALSVAAQDSGPAFIPAEYGATATLTAESIQPSYTDNACNCACGNAAMRMYRCYVRPPSLSDEERWSESLLQLLLTHQLIRLLK